MGYCKVSDVQTLNIGRSYTATSSPSSGQVSNYIEHVASLIDGRLYALGFTTPVDSSYTASYNILKTINALGAAAMAEEALFLGKEPSESSRAELHWKRYEEEMQRIEKNPNILSVSTISERPRIPEGKGLRSFMTDNTDEKFAPRFKMEDKY